MEDRFARVPIAFFEEAGDAIEIKQAPDSAAPDKASAPTRLTTRLTTDGLSDSIRILAQHCLRS
jgi:hypothetical protein